MEHALPRLSSLSTMPMSTRPFHMRRRITLWTLCWNPGVLPAERITSLRKESLNSKLSSMRRFARKPSKDKTKAPPLPRPSSISISRTATESTKSNSGQQWTNSDVFSTATKFLPSSVNMTRITQARLTINSLHKFSRLWGPEQIQTSIPCLVFYRRRQRKFCRGLDLQLKREELMV